MLYFNNRFNFNSESFVSELFSNSLVLGHKFSNLLVPSTIIIQYQTVPKIQVLFHHFF